MQTPRSQSMVGRLMLAVGLMAAVLSIGIGGMLCWRSFSYRQRARSFGQMADYWGWQAERVRELYPVQDEAEVRHNLRDAIRWNRQMADKYRRASSRPWKPVAPDPRPWEPVPPDPPGP
jgi:hypothetical protein